MSRETLALLLWMMLGLSIALMIAGIAVRSAPALLLAAALSFAFGLAAIFSIGIGILALAVSQLLLGVAFRRGNAANLPHCRETKT